MINFGPNCRCLKTGLYFNVHGGPDQVHTGDLFYDLQNQEFQIRGVPAIGQYRRHVFDHDFRGPVALHLQVKRVLETQVRQGAHYIDLRFLQAKAVGGFAAFIEESPDGAMAMAAIDANWEIVGDLTWYKG